MCMLCMQEELDTIKREQEDLLVLVTDQDSKMSEYRRKLRTYGEDVTEDEDEEDEDGDFAITENYDDDLEDIQWHTLLGGPSELVAGGGGESYVLTPYTLSYLTYAWNALKRLAYSQAWIATCKGCTKVSVPFAFFILIFLLLFFYYVCG